MTPGRRRTLVGILVAALVIATGLGIRPAYRAIKTWRAAQLVREGSAHAAAGRFEQAYAQGRAALGLSPQDPVALRFMAQLLERFKDGRALSFYDALEAQGAATVEDRRAAIGLALDLRLWDPARRRALELLKLDPPPAEAYPLAARAAEGLGDLAGALDYSRRAAQAAPGDLGNRLRLGRLLVTSREPLQRVEGKRWLLDVGEAPGADGLAALTTVAGLPDLTGAEAARCLSALIRQPGRGPAHEFIEADLKVRINPEWSAALVREKTSDTGTMDPERRLELVRWLNRHQEYAKAADIAQTEAGERARDLLLARLDALAALGLWTEIKELLGSPTSPLEPVLGALYRARAAKELKEDRLAALHWEQAHSLAEQDPKALAYLAEYAERTGNLAAAARALRKLADHPLAARAACAGWVRVTEAEGDTRRLRDVLRDVAARFPAEIEPENDLAYLSLLLGDEPGPWLAKARELMRRRPDLWAVKTTLALALLRSGDAAGAEAVYQGVDLDPASLLPGWRAVRAAVAGAAGFPERARLTVAGLGSPRLKPEELELARPWLTEQAGAGPRTAR